MNITQIRAKLESFAVSLPAPSSQFMHDAYWDDPRCVGELGLVKHPRYLSPVAEIMAELAPSSILTIGALYGTLESYLLQATQAKRSLREITICDIDLAEYNANRDNGSLVYRNICGTKYGAFDGLFTLIRGSSGDPAARRRIRSGAPYDVVFVDGEHTASAVHADMTLASECLAMGGTILVHDTSLDSSSVPQGWIRWASEYSSDWTCDAVSDDVVLLGLGFAQRTIDQ